GPVAGLSHLVDTVEQPLEVDPEQRGRDHPEHRQRRVTSPDRRLAVEDTEEPALPGQRLELRARVGDRGEELTALAGLLPEVVQLRARLERRAGLRRHDEQRRVEVERLRRVANHRGVRRVEYVERGALEGSLQN